MNKDFAYYTPYYICEYLNNGDIEIIYRSYSLKDAIDYIKFYKQQFKINDKINIIYSKDHKLVKRI